MTTPPIENSFKGADLHVIELTERSRIEFYLTNMADQINDSRNKASGLSKRPPRRIKDLSNWIADIIIETSVQGASFLEVHVIDPYWMLFQRDPKTHDSFIDTDDEGYLWPPIQVNFPPKVTDSTWRLCQVRPSSDLNTPNVILVFEDESAARLREISRPLKSGPTETRAEFIKRLIKTANDNPEYPGQKPIRFIPLLDPSTFTSADLSSSGSLPPSTQQPNPAPARADHTKGAPSLQHLVGKPKVNTRPKPAGSQATGGSVATGEIISIADGALSLAEALGSPSTFTPSGPQKGSVIGFLEGKTPLP